MSNAEYFDGEEMGAGATRDEIRVSARRQLIASIAAAIVIGVAALASAFAPQSRNYTQAPTIRAAGVQQPVFAASSTQRVAAAKQYDVELP
jgi:hypothetical protein